MAADMENRFSLWLKSIGLLKYSGQFVANGYDDLDLLTSMDADELKSMIETLGIGKKGHILKLEKSVHALQNLSGPSTGSTNTSVLKERKPTEKKLMQTGECSLILLVNLNCKFPN